MKACPECGHRLGMTSDRGFCSYVCKVVHRARIKAKRRQRRMRMLLQLLGQLQGKRPAH
jgi:predicted nucleic acid-binding Zn ribbon protein